MIPYVTDQLAMARLPRATYATMVALLPAFATIIGIVVLTQLPSWIEIAGIALVIGGVAVHRPRDAARDKPAARQATSTVPAHKPGRSGTRVRPEATWWAAANRTALNHDQAARRSSQSGSPLGIGAAFVLVLRADEHLQDPRDRAARSRASRDADG